MLKMRFLGICGLILVLASCRSFEPDLKTVEALNKAKGNRAELEKVLTHYKMLGEFQKFEAACFLIRNMSGKCYVELGWENKKKEPIEFEALDYPNYDAAVAAIDKIEKAKDGVQHRVIKRLDDLKVMKAEFLINNIDEAFAVWKKNPWSKAVSFEVFCERILPYRATNEPLDSSWRKKCQALYPNLAKRFPNPDDMRAAAESLRKDRRKYVRFDTLYYLHPTDQSFSEMMKAKLGRCEDLSNFNNFMLMANGFPIASDYTPFWPNRDNNHAWDVLLDKYGKTVNPPKYHTAKTYRKGFSYNYKNLYFRVKDKKSIPGWLSSKTYTDVTAQYQPVSDVTVTPDFGTIKPQKFIYICVFNSGAWQAIHWAEVKDGKATFSDMGRNICYVACVYVGKKLKPITSPFVVDGAGHIRKLDGVSESKPSVINAMSPKLQNVDTGKVKKLLLAPAKYTLKEWVGGDWGDVKVFDLQTDADINVELRESRLYWMTGEGLDAEARIFTVKDGKQVWW